MKNDKKIIALIAGLVALAAAVILLLTMCGRGEEAETQETSLPSETTETTQPSEQTLPEETTEATEATEATEPAETEETTEPTEEESASGGNSTPGGQGGFTGSTMPDEEEDEKDEEEETVVVSDPGAADNPYVEIIAEYPDTFTTVSIPRDGTIAYDVYGAVGGLLIIEDPAAYVICGEITYTPDENGVVTVSLEAAEEAEYVSFRIGSTQNQAVFAVAFNGQPGCATNPIRLESIELIQAVLEESDDDGIYYQWTAEKDCSVTLTVEQITPEGAACSVIVTIGDTVIELTGGTATFQVEEYDEVSIQVIAVPDGEGVYPAAEVTITGSQVSLEGAEDNPIVLALTQIPTSVDTVAIEAGESVYYDVYGAGGTILTIRDPAASVTYNGITYTADEIGVLSIALERVIGRQPTSLCFGSSEGTEGYTLYFAYPVGHSENPLAVDDIADLTVSLPEGSDSGYYISWTAPNDGVLSIEAAAVPETVEFDVILTNTANYEMAWLSDGSPVTMNVAEGDVVMIQIAISADENWNYPAADITLKGTFTILYGTEKNPYTAELGELPDSFTTVEIAPGEAVFYNVSKAAGSILTIEDAQAYVIYNGVTYTAADGVLSLEIQPDAGDTITIQVGNLSESGASYTLSFTPTTGSAGNPEVVYSLFNLNTAVTGGSYYYTWTASANGAISFWVEEENSSDVEYDIVLTSTGSDTVEKLSESAHGTVAMLVAEGDVVTIEVVLASGGSGYLDVRGAVFTGEGTEDSPYMTTVIQVPGGLATVDITNGSTISYNIYRIGDTILTIEGEDAYVIYNGTTYNSVDGVVTVRIPATMAMTPVSLTVGNRLTRTEQSNKQQEEAEAYLIRFTTVLGTYGNPEVLTDISTFTADIEQDNAMGYYYNWTAPEDGTVTFWINSITEGVEGNIQISATSTAKTAILSESETGMVSLEVEAGAKVTIIVSTIVDDTWIYPAAVIEVGGSFAPAAAEEAEEAAENTPAELAEDAETTGEQTTEDTQEAGSEPDAQAEGSVAEETPAETEMQTEPESTTENAVPETEAQAQMPEEAPADNG